MYEDLADLEVRAMTVPQAAGQRYIGSGPFMSMSEVANVLKERLGDKAKKVPTCKLPDWLVRFVGCLIARSAASCLNSARYGDCQAQKRKKGLGWSF